MEGGSPGGFANLSQRSTMGAVDQRRIRSIREPLFGDGCFSVVPTGLFDHDSLLRKTLTSDERFEAFLQFREQALEIAAAQLISASNSPADLFHLAGEEELDFRASYVYDPGMFPHYVYDNDLTSQRLYYVYRSFAFQKSLLNLDFIQKNSDCEEVLKILKSSTQWSELQDSQLRTLLQRHMNLLKEHHEMSQLDSNTRGTSRSESFKNFALEKINSELSSELDELQLVDDWAFLNQYCKFTKLNILARKCDSEAQMADIVILEEAVPIRDGYMKEHMSSGSPIESKLAIAKQKAKESMEGCMGSLRRMNPRFGRGTARGKAAFFAFSTFAAVASATWKIRREHS
ncbi:uncharacterized protein LOC133900053 isoform X1 [Phragmites australis]|uniref:uncharacterized protein LOC133900053 isoform X1 n=1 Tax=Phragmites australis TaxID=29695 RepID=UPI002D781971|nr:uncharacterized protein LOC133900053 isoform X1 [Phragmites australis]